MSQDMLPVFLCDVDDIVSILQNAGFARELLLVGKEATPLRLEQVHDIEILPPVIPVWLPCVDRKCTCESPLNQRRSFMLIQRLRRKVSSRCPG